MWYHGKMNAKMALCETNDKLLIVQKKYKLFEN